MQTINNKQYNYRFPNKNLFLLASGPDQALLTFVSSEPDADISRLKISYLYMI